MKVKWSVNLMAVAVVVAGMGLGGLVLPGVVAPAMSEVVDSVVTEVRIDDSGVRVGDTQYEVRQGRRGPDRVRVLGEDMVRFGDDIIIDEDELVDGDVVAIFGSVVVDGAVEGDVVAVMGGITLGPNGEIDGDAVAVGGSVDKERGGRIGGETVSIGTAAMVPRACPIGMAGLFSRSGKLFVLIMWTILLIVLGLIVIAVAKRPVGNVSVRARKEAFKMGLIGLLTEVLVLPVIALFCITLIGIPIGLVAIPLVFALALLLGYVGVSQAIGERMGEGAQRSVYMNMAVGILVLQGLLILGWIVRLPGGGLAIVGNVIGFIGWAVVYVAGTVGLGAVIMSKFGTKAVEVTVGVEG
jgi:hypothetical protein